MKRVPFAYDRHQPLEIRPVRSREQSGWIESELTYVTLPGRRRAASLVRPVGRGPFPCILYVHWYEPSACNANRTQFLTEARTMAQRGALSLSIETIWSDREWFIKRTQAEDYRASVEQVIELRRAIDLLSQQPGADAARLAYVGHDFGAMYGVTMGSSDPRPTCYVLMAATPCFADWYLYYPSLKGEERESYVCKMAPLDPIERVAQLAPAPILFQFAREDPHVPIDRAEALFAAAHEPKEVRWYEAGHGLNEDATTERITWLVTQLQLKSPPLAASRER